ncbi:Protein of unknown function [Desulfuromusa kysingii]|uniref:Lipase (Class 3) n=1 Tax=Desulfuromusa kysingii TaxID=37625 RepID=A0A1H4EFM6_9BACT|nr:DUF6792 domain-containing protein [Desulfuromusa kysingii]SEA83619.1 Protein of unknown function [Desulfuromusa kysingii]
MSSFDQLVNAQLSEKAYSDFDPTDVDNATTAFTDSNGSDWTVYTVSETSGYNTGFSGVAFRNEDTKEVVVAYRGTDGPRDVTPDLQAGLGQNVPNQYQQAKDFYDAVLDKTNTDSSNSPTLTGHSLGGALAQLVGAVTGAETQTYNAPGVKDVLYNNPSTFGVFSETATFDNIKNNNFFLDTIHMVGEQLGNSITIGGELSQAVIDAIKVLMTNFGRLLPSTLEFLVDQHGIGTMVDSLARLLGGYPAADGLSDPTNPDASSDNKNDLSSEDFSSPLVLDLNNNDRTSTLLMMADTYFDLDGDGFAERTGWIEAEDGLLVLDKNQNGNVDNGNELFGNYSQNQDGHLAENGFAALTDYDINNDGIINADDDVFESLQVWADANSDGISQDGELHSLSDLHIESINLNATEVNTEEKWNQISHESTFTQQAVDDDGNVVTDQDGNAVLEVKAVHDVWFASDRQDTTYQYEGEVSADIAALPEMKGMGRVMNLSHSMVADATLQQQVETLLASANRDLATIYSNADAVLARWAHADDIATDESRGEQHVLNHNYNNPQAKYVYREYASNRVSNNPGTLCR